ncbi:helix-turn-helix domain-containing protein [Nonomuraea sp. NPDC049684]
MAAVVIAKAAQSVTAIARYLKIGRSTLYRALAAEEDPAEAPTSS